MIEVLFPRVRRSVLSILLGQPDRQLDLREIVRMAHGGKGAVERELRALTSAGIILRVESGGRVLFSANRNCPIFQELHMLMIKTESISGLLGLWIPTGRKRNGQAGMEHQLNPDP